MRYEEWDKLTWEEKMRLADEERIQSERDDLDLMLSDINRSVESVGDRANRTGNSDLEKARLYLELAKQYIQDYVQEYRP